MATSTLANSPSTPEFDGRLIEDLTDLAPDPEQPKPPQPDPRFSITTPTDEERRERNAAMLNTIWALGESLVRPTLKDALHGFPDVNSYYADAAGR